MKPAGKRIGIVDAAVGILGLESHAKANIAIGGKLTEKGIHWQKKQKSAESSPERLLGTDPTKSERLHNIAHSDVVKLSPSKLKKINILNEVKVREEAMNKKTQRFEEKIQKEIEDTMVNPTGN